MKQKSTSEAAWGTETSWTAVLYTRHGSPSPCSDNRMTQKYKGHIKTSAGRTAAPHRNPAVQQLTENPDSISPQPSVLYPLPTSCLSRFVHPGGGEVFLPGEGRTSQGGSRSGLGPAGPGSGPNVLQETGPSPSWKNPSVVEYQVKPQSSSLKRLHPHTSESIVTDACAHVLVQLLPLVDLVRGIPLRRDEEEAPEEGPPAVPGGVRYLQV